MLLRMTLDGTLSLFNPSTLNQGSITANKLEILAPFASGSAVTVAFRLPNGQATTPAIATLVSSGSAVVSEDHEWNLWELTVQAPITQYAGTLGIQVYVTADQATTASTLLELTINKGVAYIQPQTNIATWNAILQIYNQILTKSGSAEEASEAAIAAKNAAIAAKNDAVSAKDDAVSAQNAAISAKNEIINQKGQANGIATLDGNGRLPESQISSAQIAVNQSLQTQIDNLKSASDVVDIVSTYADLLAYDTSKLTDKDIVKVLSDSTHDGKQSYYRWIVAVPSGSWNYIGSIGSLTPSQLAGMVQGDDFITADLNDGGTKVAFSLDANYKPWVVELTGTSGTLSDTDFAKLTISKEAKILIGNEYYEKSDVQSDHTVFTHFGKNNQQQASLQTVYIYTDSSSVLYKTWTLTSEVVGGETYTAGDGIAITDNEISVKVGEGLFFDSNDAVCLNAATRNTLASVANKQDATDNTLATTSKNVVGAINELRSDLLTKARVSGAYDGNNWTSISINGQRKNIPSGGGGGTTVVANPTLVGTEAELTGLQVGDTKYKAIAKITANGVLQGDGNGNVTAKAVDTTPTSGSSNLITSGGVATALSGKSTVTGTNDGTNWTSLTLNGNTKNIPAGGGTTVVANPTLAGTESNLTGLQVGGTKYKVPSGDAFVIDLTFIPEYQEEGDYFYFSSQSAQDVIDAIVAKKAIILRTFENYFLCTYVVQTDENAYELRAFSNSSNAYIGSALIRGVVRLNETPNIGFYEELNYEYAPGIGIELGGWAGTLISVDADSTPTSGSAKPVTSGGVYTALAGKSAVSGTNDGTNWTTLTIEGVSKNIPSGGGGSIAGIAVGEGTNSLVYNDTTNNTATGENANASGDSTIKVPAAVKTKSTADIITDWSARGDNKYSLAKGNNSTVEGSNNLALEKNAHAEGNGTIAANNSAHSEGTGTQALGKYSHAEGLETKASANCAHSEGYQTEVTGLDGAHAEGKYTKATGNYSHAEGYQTIANNESSHAEGYNTKAYGSGSHSEGQDTIAYQRGQHAEGVGTLCSNLPADESQHVAGFYNVQKSGARLTGNGTSSNRKNIEELDWSGNLMITGNLKAAGLTDGTTTKTMSQMLAGATINDTTPSASTTYSSQKIETIVGNIESLLSAI